MSNDLVHIYEDKCVKMLFSTKNNMSKDHKLHTYIFLTHFMERYHVKKKKVLSKNARKFGTSKICASYSFFFV